MKEFFGLLFLALTGPGFLVLGVQTLRSRGWQDGVPALELVIDRALGEEPPERTAWDQRFARFHAWIMIIFGSFFSLCLAAAIFALIS